MAAFVWVVDVITKVLAVAHLEDQPEIELAGGLLTLTFLRNSGAAFGLAQGYTAVLALVMIVVIIVIIRMARRLASTGWAVALGLLLGGALGNLTDRMFREPGPFRGAVVDFLELPNWPVFNIADTGITCAAVLIVLLTFRGVSVEGKVPRRGSDSDSDSGVTEDGAAESAAAEDGRIEGGADEAASDSAKESGSAKDSEQEPDAADSTADAVDLPDAADLPDVDGVGDRAAAGVPDEEDPVGRGSR